MGPRAETGEQAGSGRRGWEVGTCAPVPCPGQALGLCPRRGYQVFGGTHLAGPGALLAAARLLHAAALVTMRRLSAAACSQLGKPQYSDEPTTIPTPSSPAPLASRQPSYLISGSEPGQPPSLGWGWGACHCAWLSDTWPVLTGDWKCMAVRETRSHWLAPRAAQAERLYRVCLGTGLSFPKRLFQSLYCYFWIPGAWLVADHQ